MPEVRRGRPPNFVDIAKVLPEAYRPDIIFAYAPFIYTMSPKPLAPQLIAHEQVHIERQQIAGVGEWWFAYLHNPRFRYDEELLAHRAELRAMNGLNRASKRAAIKTLVKRLSGPIYGNVRTPRQVEEDLLA